MIIPRTILSLAAVLLLAGPLAARSAAPDTGRGDAGGDEPEWIEGRGEHELVLVHGLGASAEIWDPVMPYLANAFRVHVYELHGHGTTEPLPDPSIASEAEALHEWILAQGLIYPTIVGHGLGGMIAMQYAMEHPADVDRLVVIDAGPKQIAAEAHKQEVAHSLLEEYDQFVASRFVGISSDPEICDQAVDWALRTDAVSFTSLLLSSFDWDLTDELADQSVPMLVIGSEAYLPEQGYEREFLKQYGYESARVLSFKRIDGTGHYLMLEKPTYLASVLTVYLRAEEFR